MTIDQNGILRDYTQNDLNCAYSHSWCVVNHGAKRTGGLLDHAYRLSLVEALGIQRHYWECYAQELDIALANLDENVWTWDNRAQRERIYWHGAERRAGFDELD